ncbi:glycosyltransferase [Sphingomonas baiyangensis]|uniref:Glycosyltransferase n=1 Tax=Sphingomonas baiyangensis TaxID=2572576 RepID=A0A4V6WRF6_9SPHN|nr:glycosyltransferase [Sphingomonas baiyangensis]TKD51028.1 glycosyltransferase [Sphingomonas baiyangensis]
MRRVAFVLPHFGAGGAERCVLNWLGALDRTRFSPLLMLGRREGEFLALVPRDVPVIDIGGRRALTRPLAIARRLAEHRVDIAYAATSAMNLALMAAPTRCRRIVSEHTPPEAYLAEAKWRAPRVAAMRLLYPRADAVAVPTVAIGEAVAAIVPRARTAVIANPVVQAASLPVTPPDLHADSGHIVSAGRLVAAKGYDVLIDAVALLAARGAAVTLDIHGDGPLRGALEARIAGSGAASRIRLMGHSAALGCAIAEADLFVLASRREGFGNVLIEAMAAGTPVLATRAGGPEQFIVDGVNGFLVAPGDAKVLADRIAGLLADRDARIAVRAPALVTARDYTIEASTRTFEAMIDALPARRRT